MRQVLLTNGRDLLEFLEKEIAAGRNPTTFDEWNSLIERMRIAGKALNIGATDKNPEEIIDELGGSNGSSEESE